MTERTAVRYLMVSVGAGIAAAIVVLWIYGATQKDDKQQAQAELVQSAETIKAACAKDPATVRTLLGTDACTKAKEITERPPAQKGDTGARGPMGPQGPRGPAGPPGRAGTNGASPGCLILVSKCQGPPGPRGFQGLTGPTGPAGADGADPVDGKDGVDGADGADGAAGKDGAPGKEGPPGPPGPAGPACPDGSSLQTVHVITTEAPTGTAVQACVITDQNPPTSKEQR